jgi:exopolysaccharide biosynthesis polyprenyl glycosylphosphotransferase
MKFPSYKYILFFIDVIVVFAAFSLSIRWRFGYFMPQEYLAAAVLPLLAAFVFQYNNLYRINIFLDRSASFVMLLKSIMILSILYAIGGFLTRFVLIVPSRLAFAYFVLSAIFFLGTYRVIFLPVVFEKLSVRGIQRRKLLVVGAGKCAQDFVKEATASKKYGLHIAGFLDDKIPVGTGVLNGYKVIGDSSEIDLLTKELGCDEIVIAINKISHTKLLSLINESKNTGATVRVVSNLVEPVSSASITEAYTIHPAVTVTRGLYSDVTEIYQRISDLIISSIALLILSPFFLIAAAAIKLSSKGPVFYIHERIGKKGKTFRMYKFRSMKVSENGDAKREKMMIEFIGGGKGNNGAGKVIDNSRVTGIGKILRKTSFDELPQLINVIKGEMSLVGPRPALPYEYHAMKDWHRERGKMLPGCTGFWQVYGRGSTSFDDMVMMDLYMMENMSPWLYLQLLFKTFPVLVIGRGAK